MFPILYENSETQFTSNGIGRLSDAIECTVHEVRNGEYELNLMYPVTGKYAQELKEWRIIGATHDNNGDIQPFDIYKVSKPSHGVIEVKAHHISYRTNKIIVRPSSTVDVPLQSLFDSWTSDWIIGPCPFSFYSDLQINGTLLQENFQSIRHYLYGQDEDGILACYGYDGGDYKLDKWNISFLAHRGQNTGAKFRTGNNVRLLTSETDIDDVITAVVPFWYGKHPITGEKTYVDLESKGFIVYFDGAETHAQQLTKQLDLSNVFEQPPTEEELEDAAQEWMHRHNFNTVHRESYLIQTTAETEEPLNQCNLCDTVIVEDTVNNYRVYLMVTETTWNCLKNRYDNIIVGDRRPILTEQFKRQNAIYIQQIANNQEQISAIAKKKAQVEQTVTPSTTTGATKIGSVDGTDLYAPPSGSSGGGDSEWGGRDNAYGTATLYANRSGATPSARTNPKWVLNNLGFRIPEWSKTEYGLYGPQWDIQYNDGEIGIFDACAYKQTTGNTSDRGVHSKTRLGKGIFQIEQFKGTNDTDWTNTVKIGHSANRSDTQTDYGTVKSENHIYGKTTLHDVVSLPQDFTFDNRDMHGIRLPGSGGCLLFDSLMYRLIFAACDENGNAQPFSNGYIWTANFTAEQVN